MFDKQVDKSHYDFDSYMSKQRWSSVWHQLDEIQKTKPSSVLEIGAGLGVLKAVAKRFDIDIKTLDIDPELEPDYLSSVVNMPFNNEEFDVVCAFQMLEHLPYDVALQAFQEMVRVSKGKVIISLPDAKAVYRFLLQVPKLGSIEFFYTRPRLSSLKHKFDGEHYWEINKKGYSLKKIMKDFSSFALLENNYRVNENPYHRFFIFNKFNF